MTMPDPGMREFIRVGKSRIEGTGVFAKRKIPRGTRIIEYTGERVPIGAVYHEVIDGEPSRVYAFALDATTAIDGTRNGNEARFFNHSCAPNCEAYIFDERAYLYALRDIRRGEELTFDYQLGPVDQTTIPQYHEAEYACRCGAPECRGSLIASRWSPKGTG